eukprot:3475075-Rhodomonas_salina.1
MDTDNEGEQWQQCNEQDGLAGAIAYEVAQCSATATTRSGWKFGQKSRQGKWVKIEGRRRGRESFRW